ncbi:MAG TPA: ABC transporter ATP-binding protein [Thermoanaerobaculia bacterium]|nr:ABC transporter ATP-binding protein [Thermoanaerobaculia bacterium]
MAFGRESDRVKIRLAGVEKSFGPKRVLDGLDLEVHEGESLVIIGGSGSGKSVLLKHVIGLLHPDAGTVHVDHVEIHRLSNREITRFRRRFGMAFQEGALFDSMTVRQNVAFPLVRQTKLSRREVDARVDECLEMVRLTGAAEKLPAQLSGGMRRRAGFARAIAMEPDIVLFDEPTTGLDPVTTAVIDEVIVDMLRRLPSTAITITHDMTSAFRIADRIGMIYEGRIIALAPPDEIRRTADPRVRQFIEGRSIGPLAAPEEPGAAAPPSAAATPSRDPSRGAPSPP